MKPNYIRIIWIGNMDEWIDKTINEWMNKSSMDRWMDKLTDSHDRNVGGRVQYWMDRLMDGWSDREMDK